LIKVQTSKGFREPVLRESKAEQGSRGTRRGRMQFGNRVYRRVRIRVGAR
jgi:hypothetical protein